MFKQPTCILHILDFYIHNIIIHLQALNSWDDRKHSTDYWIPRNLMFFNRQKVQFSSIPQPPLYNALFHSQQQILLSEKRSSEFNTVLRFVLHCITFTSYNYDIRHIYILISRYITYMHLIIRIRTYDVTISICATDLRTSLL